MSSKVVASGVAYAAVLCLIAHEQNINMLRACPCPVSQSARQEALLLVGIAGCSGLLCIQAVCSCALPAHHSAFIDWYTDQLDKLSPLFGKAGPLLHHRTRVHKGCKVVGNSAYVVNLCM